MLPAALLVKVVPATFQRPAVACRLLLFVKLPELMHQAQLPELAVPLLVKLVALTFTAPRHCLAACRLLMRSSG